MQGHCKGEIRSEAKEYVNFTVQKDAGVKSASVLVRDNFDTEHLTDVTTEGKAEVKAGRWLCVKVELNEGFAVESVKSGETAGFSRKDTTALTLPKQERMLSTSSPRLLLLPNLI